jgi:hypothetical protein
MDVRAADTSSLAAKRLEMDGVKPIKDKQGFNQDGYVNRVIPQKEHKKHHAHQENQAEPHEEEETDSRQLLDTKVEGGYHDDHVLDVKV